MGYIKLRVNRNVAVLLKNRFRARWTMMRFFLVVVAIILRPRFLSRLHSQLRRTDFAAALRSAIQEKSWPKIQALTYQVGMSDSDKQLVEMMKQVYFSGGDIADISFESLPPNFGAVNIMAGKKFEPTYPPAGIVKIMFKANLEWDELNEPAYAIVDGHYYLVSTKTTDLGWKGPPDRTFNINALSTSPQGVTVLVKWNASGVEQQETVTATSAIVNGQYIENVLATSPNDANTMTLVVTEGADKEIFRSKPLQGRGTLEYKKP